MCFPGARHRDGLARKEHLVTDNSTAESRPTPDIDPHVPHSARVWNYWLDGKDNFAADREAAGRISEAYPDIVEVARVSRAFLVRAIRFLVGEAGIRQFLDIGTGLPTANNTHEVAQGIVPECRVVYVDNDPLVLVHARALLTSTSEGATDYIDADVHDPERILQAAARTLDFSQPVALMMLGILGNVVDDDEAMAITSTLLAAVPPGSFIVINDGTKSEQRDEAFRVGSDVGITYVVRTPEQIAGFFRDVELLEPGVVSTPHWRPDPGTDLPPALDVYCGVGRKS